jgi:tetraacyldisaccharide 4'-kinase
MSLVDDIWHGDSASARASRALLTPAERMFAAVVARRNAKFDREPSRRTMVPAMSVGNLTVGGTGKTPVAAWCTSRLRAMHGAPAIVLRGYGDDEWRVHALLNPDVPVIVSPDRVGGIAAAATRGADCVVLDDAFQHRQASRVVDLVLVSADRWREPVRLLPAGPYREPMASLSRATVAVITVKSAGDEAVAALVRAIEAAAPRIPIAVVRLRLGRLQLAARLNAAPTGTSPSGRPRRAAPEKRSQDMLSHDLAWLAGRRIVVAAAVGDPEAFVSQLRGSGAEIRDALRFADHHGFSEADAVRIARRAEGTDGVVCTLKDAVKLHTVWPREATPLWYVSQSVVVDRGAEALDRAFARMLAARTATAFNAG